MDFDFDQLGDTAKVMLEVDPPLTQTTTLTLHIEYEDGSRPPNHQSFSVQIDDSDIGGSHYSNDYSNQINAFVFTVPLPVKSTGQYALSVIQLVPPIFYNDLELVLQAPITVNLESLPGYSVDPLNDRFTITIQPLPNISTTPVASTTGQYTTTLPPMLSTTLPMQASPHPAGAKIYTWEWSTTDSNYRWAGEFTLVGGVKASITQRIRGKLEQASAPSSTRKDISVASHYIDVYKKGSDGEELIWTLDLYGTSAQAAMFEDGQNLPYAKDEKADPAGTGDASPYYYRKGQGSNRNMGEPLDIYENFTYAPNGSGGTADSTISIPSINSEVTAFRVGPPRIDRSANGVLSTEDGDERNITGSIQGDTTIIVTEPAD